MEDGSAMCSAESKEYVFKGKMTGLGGRAEEDEDNEDINEEDCKKDEDQGEHSLVVPRVGEGVEGDVTETAEDAVPLTVSGDPGGVEDWSGVRDGLLQDIEHYHTGSLVGPSATLFRINPFKLLALRTAAGGLGVVQGQLLPHHALTGTLGLA